MAKRLEDALLVCGALSSPLYVAVGVVGLFATPLHLKDGRIAEGDPINALHASVTAVTAILMFAFIGFAAASRGRRFRAYSAITVVTPLLGGGLTFLAALWPPAHSLQSVLGVLERVNVYGCMLWLTVLAIALMRDTRAMPTRSLSVGAA